MGKNWFKNNKLGNISIIKSAKQKIKSFPTNHPTMTKAGISVGKFAKGTGKFAKGTIKGLTSRGAMGGILAIGSIAMMGLGFMRGMNNQAKDIMYDRYMKDTRYSRSMAANTMVGQASNRNSMLNRMGSDGSLGLSLSKSRHGRY